MWTSFNWIHLLLFPVAYLCFRWTVRILDRLVTKVRASRGLAMAWGTAILGFVVILGGMAALAAIPVLLA